MNRQYYEEGKKMVQDSNQLFIDFDVESDGKPGHGSLLSIGGVSPYGEEFYTELAPSSELWVPSQRQFCEEHGLNRDRLIREGACPEEAMQEFVNWAVGLRQKYNKKGIVLAAFNASFDFPWIDLELTKSGIESPFGVAGFCIKSLAMSISQAYDWRDTAKNNLPKEIIPDGDFTHNALEDAIYQQQLHFGLVGLMRHIQCQEHIDE